MASEPVATHQENVSESPDPGEDPFSPGSPSMVLAGLLIAFTTVSAPLIAVVTDRGALSDRLIPAGLEHDGSQPTAPFTVLGSGQPAGGNTSW